MNRKPYLLYGILCLWLSCILISCQKDKHTDKITQQKLFKNFSLENAREFFENNADDLKLADLLGNAIPTKGDFHQVLENLSPDWNHAIQYEDKLSYIYEVPIKSKKILDGALVKPLGKYQGIKTGGVKIEHHLIIQKFHKDNATRFFIVSAIGDAKNSTNAIKNQSPYNYCGNRHNFEGYLIFSDVNGKAREAFYYCNGIRRHAGLREKTDKDTSRNANYGFILLVNKPQTKGGGDYVGGENSHYCPFCGLFIGDFACPACSELDKVVIIDDGVYCYGCSQYKGMCICRTCDKCGQDPCQCDTPYPPNNYCDYCGSPNCNGECKENVTEPDPPKTPDEPIQFDITLNATHGGSVMGGGTYNKDSYASVSGLCSSGYIFGCWSENALIASTNSLFSFKVTSHRCLTGNFYIKDSECGKLFMKYNNHTGLKDIIRQLNEKKAGNNLEYAFLLSTDNQIESFTGEVGRAKFNLNKQKDYSLIVHNHPDTPIPSIEDILEIYRAHVAGIFKKGSAIIMQTNTGTMSIEIDDFIKFEEFLWNICGRYGESIDSFKSDFHNTILGNPEEKDIGTETIVNKAIAFYSNDSGLKVAYTSSDGSSPNWSFANNTNGSLTFNNCINKKL